MRNLATRHPERSEGSVLSEWKWMGVLPFGFTQGGFFRMTHECYSMNQIRDLGKFSGEQNFP